MPRTNERSYLEVWFKPEPNHEYVIGADVAEGLAHGDYSVAYIFDRHAQRYVAEWHGHVDSDVFAALLHDLARWYNDALVIPEDNGPGQTVISRLREVYYNIFIRKVADAVQGIIHDVYGYRTTWRSKPYLIDALKQYVRETKAMVPVALLDELATYIYDDAGKMNAQSGTYDDRVIAGALCIRADLDLPPPPELPKILPPGGARNAEWVWREVRGIERAIAERKAYETAQQTIDEVERKAAIDEDEEMALQLF